MMYKKYPALYADANGYDGFQWINADDADRSIYSFIRWSPTKRNNLLFVCNFTPVERKDYWVGVPQKKAVQTDPQQCRSDVRRQPSRRKYGIQTGKRRMRRTSISHRISASGIWGCSVCI